MRVLLVAESHVAEQAGDAEVAVRLPSVIGPVPRLPDGYCRIMQYLRSEYWYRIVTPLRTYSQWRDDALCEVGRLAPTEPPHPAD